MNSRKALISQISLDAGLRRIPDLDHSYDSAKKRKTVKMRMSSDEMRAFCHYFTFIVGPYIPNDDPVWKYCTILIKMVDQILSKDFTLERIANLEKIISEHHTLYQSLFKTNLKPKHHFILHYPPVISACGPVSRMMCFRNEAKHQAFKEYAHVITSRTNVAYTLCMKSCLQFSHDIYSKTLNDTRPQGNFKINTISSRPYHEHITNMSFERNEPVEFTSTLTFKGHQFSAGNFITMSTKTQMNLYEIEEFIYYQESIKIVARHWTLGHFCEHYLATEAIIRLQQLSIIDMESIDGPPFTVHSIGDKFMFRNKCTF